MKSKYNQFLVLTVLLHTAGCTVGPDYHKRHYDITDQWHHQDQNLTSQHDYEANWWAVFNDSILNQLIESAVNHNHDIRKASTNIERARALRQASSSGWWPRFDFELEGERQGFSKRTLGTNISVPDRTTYTDNLDASWELDFFGHVRRAVEATDANMKESIEAKRQIMLTVVAEVTRNYFEIRGLQKGIEVKKRNVKLLKEVEDLVKVQFDLGDVSEFDYTRAKGERQATEANLPNLEAEMRSGTYRLSVLTGQVPEYHLSALSEKKSLPSVPDIVPVGLRSEILKRRPDIRQAEYKMIAANAEVGVATAALYPQFSLTGAVGTSARLFSDLFQNDSFTYSWGGILNWPIFQGGALRANIKVQEAELESAIINYEQVIMTAFEDVEASLMRYVKEWQTYHKLHDAEKTQKEVFNIAKLRYQAGEENFLVILDAEREMIDIQDQLIASETRIFTNLTTLYKALGGGWEVI